MKPTVYLETSILGYVASRPSRDLVTAANQQITRDWWENHRSRFDLFISQAVVQECSKGDPIAAQERLDLLKGISHLQLTKPVQKLAKALVRRVSLPAKARIDALHIAVSAVHRAEYLLTWNCTHIANMELRDRIVKACEVAGFAAPKICTPPELMGG